MGLSIVALGIGIFSYGIWLYSDYVNFECNDTVGVREPSFPDAASLCESPDNGIEKMVRAAFVGMIGSVLLLLNKYAKPVTVK